MNRELERERESLHEEERACMRKRAGEIETGYTFEKIGQTDRQLQINGW
jgi:hypothetical protein